jgi:hypothetical protein
MPGSFNAELMLVVTAVLAGTTVLALTRC